jgi:PAS domain S-box-containing protein
MRERPGPSKLAAWLGGDLDRALELVTVPAFVLDRNGTIRWQNKRCIELFGDFRGEPFTAPVAPQSEQIVRTEVAKKLLGTTNVADYEATFRTRSGKLVPVEVHSVSIGNDARVVGIFGIVDVDSAKAGPNAAPPELTPRQFEVLDALGRGCSTKQIAEGAFISQETVRNHVRSLLRALHVHSRLEAVAEARRRGLIS